MRRSQRPAEKTSPDPRTVQRFSLTLDVPSGRRKARLSHWQSFTYALSGGRSDIEANPASAHIFSASLCDLCRDCFFSCCRSPDRISAAPGNYFPAGGSRRCRPNDLPSAIVQIQEQMPVGRRRGAPVAADGTGGCGQRASAGSCPPRDHQTKSETGGPNANRSSYLEREHDRGRAWRLRPSGGSFLYLERGVYLCIGKKQL
jgi:hypothetical protein